MLNGSEPGLLFTIAGRIEHSEVPALLVFDRGWPVGIEHVSLVEDGLGDLLDPVQIHELTSTSAVKCALQSLLPRWNAMLHLVLIKALEDIFAQVDPHGVGVVGVHHFAPHFDRELVARFLLPGNGRDLQRAVSRRIEDGSAEEQFSGMSPSARPAKYLVAATLKSKVHGTCSRRPCQIPSKAGNHHIDVGPEHAAQCLAPAVGLAEEIEQAAPAPRVCSGGA